MNVPSVSASLRLPDFRRIATAYVVNDLGNWLGDVALAIVVYGTTKSTLATALLLVATRGIPGLIAPALATRFAALPLRRILPLLHLAEAAIFVVLAVTLPSLPWGVVVAVAALEGVLAVGSRALTRAAVASVLTPAGLLREGNTLVNLGFTLTTVLGPSLAGVLVVTAGEQATLALDSITFLVAAGLLARIERRSLADGTTGWRERLRDGLSFLDDAPNMRPLLVAQGLALVFFVAAEPIEVAFATDVLHAGSEGFGAMLAAWGLGMPVGALLFARRRRHDLARLTGVATLAVGISYVAIAVSPTLLLACAAAALGGAGNAAQWVGFVTLVQDRTPDRHQAAVSGVIEAIASVAPALGFALGGTVAAIADPRAGFLVAGLGVLAVLSAAALTWRGTPAPVAPAPRPVGTL